MPAEALIRTGRRALLYVLDDGSAGRYRPLEVQAGQSPGYRGGPTTFVASTQMIVPMIAMPRVQPG